MMGDDDDDGGCAGHRLSLIRNSGSPWKAIRALVMSRRPTNLSTFALKTRRRFGWNLGWDGLAFAVFFFSTAGTERMFVFCTKNGLFQFQKQSVM